MPIYTAISVPQNTKLSVNDPLPIAAIGGDNATPFYLFFPQMPAGLQWVFPFIYGFLYPFPVPQYQPIVIDSTTQPAGAQPPAAGSSARSQLTAYRAEAGFVPAFSPGTPSIAATIVRWNIFQTPTAGNKASATKAASAGVTHIADSAIPSSISNTAAPSSPFGTIQIIDGPSGGPNVLSAWNMPFPSVIGEGAVVPFGPGLNFRGTVGNAMTFEYVGAVTNGVESVSLSGYDQ